MVAAGRFRVFADWSLGRRGGPEGVHAGGRWGPPARRRRRFSPFFLFLRDFVLVFMGIRRTSGHAITRSRLATACQRG